MARSLRHDQMYERWLVARTHCRDGSVIENYSEGYYASYNEMGLKTRKKYIHQNRKQEYNQNNK